MSTFTVEVTAPEAQCFFQCQAAQENVHAEVYSLFIDRLVADDEKKESLFNALEKCPIVAKKAKWALKWARPELDFPTPCCMERGGGLLFAASFAAIAFFKPEGFSRVLVLPTNTSHETSLSTAPLRPSACTSTTSSTNFQWREFTKSCPRRSPLRTNSLRRLSR